ncbi:methylcytosine dioxygenase TET-like isoform X5 [Periplaneta americana]|uniref:methylcytosine dioxygenase TET-like isoform X5 n=1 Tax=Periplaneta americana TaxID=6978 RepID=UPI0037E7D20E
MLTKTCTRSSYKPWLDSIPIINPATSSTGNINSLPQHGLYSQVGSPSPSMTDIAGDEDYDNNNNSYEASQHQDGTQKVDPKESFGLGDVSSVSMDGARMPKKRKRCGKCSGCTTVGNCGQCPPCNSIRTHQVCRQRRCTNLMMETVTSPGNKRSRSNAQQKLQQMVSNGQNGGKPPVGPPPSYGGSVMAQPQRNLGATVGRMPTQYGGLLPVARPTNMQGHHMLPTYAMYPGDPRGGGLAALQQQQRLMSSQFPPRHPHMGFTVRPPHYFL